MPPRGRTAPRIRRPVIQAHDPKRKSRGKKIETIEEDEVPEDKEPEIPPPERDDSWWDNLPPVIKPDQELHLQLVKERRAAEKVRNTEFCRRELIAIFNFAMRMAKEPSDLTEKQKCDRYAIARSNFMQEKFHEAVVKEVEVEVVEQEAKKRDPRYPDIKELLDTKNVSPLEETMQMLTRSTSQNKFTCDSNPEVDRLLSVLEARRAPYVSRFVPETRVEFPYIVGVVGPPCSGKSTVCQFIAKFFRVKTIEVSEHPEGTPGDDYVVLETKDDRVIVAGIIDEAKKLPDQTGLLLMGYPETKAQLLNLQKALQTASKRKTEPAKIGSMIGFIRMSMTAEEAAAQVEGRLVDERDGTIYHKTFNPPIVLKGEDAACFKPLPKGEEFAMYPRIAQMLAKTDIGMKKFGYCVTIPLCDSIGKLQLSIENFLKILYTSKGGTAPFSTFVVFESNEDFLFSKICTEIYDVWHDRCLPLFGTGLAELCNRINQTKHKISYLYNNTKKAFQLVTLRPDDRLARTREFLQNKNEVEESLFSYIWQKSVDLRDENLRTARAFVQKSSLRSLRFVLEASEQSIFELIVKRYFVVEWFTKEYARIIDERIITDTENITRDPVIPEYDVTNLRGLCELMGIEAYIPMSGSQSKLTILNPEPEPKQTKEIKVNNSLLCTPKLQNSASFHMDPAKIATKRSGPVPLVVSKKMQKRKNPFASRIFFKLCSSGTTPVSSSNPTPRGDDGPPKPPSREETIMNFLQYVRQENRKEVMRKEAKVMINIFKYFISKREEIEQTVDKRIDDLRKDLEHLVRQKCAREMEAFSENLRKYRLAKKYEDLFVYDTSFLDDETRGLYDELDGIIPQESDTPHFDVAKLKQMYVSVKSENSPFVSLSLLLKKADEVGLDSKEKATLHVIVQRSYLPDFVDRDALFNNISPSIVEEVEAEELETARREEAERQRRLEMELAKRRAQEEEEKKEREREESEAKAASEQTRPNTGFPDYPIPTTNPLNRTSKSERPSSRRLRSTSTKLAKTQRSVKNLPTAHPATTRGRK